MRKLNQLILVGLLFVTTTTGGMAEDAENFSLKSRDWINPRLRDIHANVTVQRITPRLYSLQYSFDVPLDPVRGVNPTEFHFFTFCLASYLSAKHEHSRWSFGTTDKNVKYRNTNAIELFVAVLDDGEKPEIVAERDDIYWRGADSNDKNREMCGRLLRNEYIWW